MEIHFPKQITPIEQWLLNAVDTCLEGEHKERFRQQVQQINKVQRLAGWKEIDYYHTSFLRKVPWDAESLFDNRDEFSLGEFVYLVNGSCITSRVRAINGHLFSIESDTRLDRYAQTDPGQITLVAVNIDLALTRH